MIYLKKKKELAMIIFSSWTSIQHNISNHLCIYLMPEKQQEAWGWKNKTEREGWPDERISWQSSISSFKLRDFSEYKKTD